MRIIPWLFAIGCGASTPAVTTPTPVDAPDAATIAAPKWQPRNGPSIEQLLGVHRADAPSFAADGSIAFVSDAPGVQQAFVVKGESAQKESAWMRLLPGESERISHVVAKNRAYFFTRDTGGDENFQILRSSDGKTATDLTAKPKVRHELGAFSDDGKELAFSSTERNGKDFDIYVQGTQTGAPTRVFDADGSYTAESFSPDGKKLVIMHERSSFDHELLLLDAHAPAKTQKPIALVPHEGIARGKFLAVVKAKDGLDVPVFVFRPRGTIGKAPAIVSVHGGPEAQAQPLFNPLVQFLVGHGYVVAQPNIRGSTGYGKKYAHLDDKTDGDLLDRLSPIHKTDRIKAPLFVIHGANDPRVPLAKAEQIVGALKARKVRVDIAAFIVEYEGSTESPYAEMVEVLREARAAR